MKPNYANWIPKWMILAFGAAAIVFAACCAVTLLLWKGTAATVLSIVFGAGAIACALYAVWALYAYRQFSYAGKRRLSKQIIEGTAAYITLPRGGTGLDVGCGSGALTIACAKRNPQGYMIGVDPWGPEYKAFSKVVCESNAKAEGVENIRFQAGNAISLPFVNERFDAVTSNYVYHNIAGADKQQLLLETLRVLKKGGCFALHDIMSPRRYRDMRKFSDKLRSMGYEEVKLIRTDDGLFMSKREATLLTLRHSMLLVGRK